MNLYIVLQQEIGLKSDKVTGLGILGIRERDVWFTEDNNLPVMKK